MNAASVAFERQYMPSLWVPFGAAVTFHFLLLAWNPTMFASGPGLPDIPTMQVVFKDELPPVVEAPKPVPPPKPVEKKKELPKKAHKSGLAMAHKKPLPPAPVAHARPAPEPKKFVSKITIPKFVPHAMDDEPIAASPLPGITAPAAKPMTTFKSPILKSKSRGIRASDINFELTDKSSLAANTHIVAIPIGESAGDRAELPNAPALHNAPQGLTSGYKIHPGLGSGSGELAGKNRVGFHGAIAAPTYTSGEGVASGSQGQTKTTIGQGFEVAGPVGDRKILRRKLPEYPSWAEEKGITAMVRIYFTVKPDGTIRSNIRLERSSGYTELDKLAKEALMNWRFSSTSASSGEEAWGVITFKFTLA